MKGKEAAAGLPLVKVGRKRHLGGALSLPVQSSRCSMTLFTQLWPFLL